MHKRVPSDCLPIAEVFARAFHGPYFSVFPYHRNWRQSDPGNHGGAVPDFASTREARRYVTHIDSDAMILTCTRSQLTVESTDIIFVA